MPDFAPVFAALRTTLLAAADGLVVARDEPGDLLVLVGEAEWFGTVTIKRSYVAYHLPPLYAAPALADGLSPALAQRRQGKTCFNFTRVDAALFAELAALTTRVRAAVDRPPPAA